MPHNLLSVVLIHLIHLHAPPLIRAGTRGGYCNIRKPASFIAHLQPKVPPSTRQAALWVRAAGQLVHWPAICLRDRHYKGKSQGFQPGSLTISAAEPGRNRAECIRGQRHCLRK
eukprot:scaffold65406_cov16-Tisochrysis_lutea.AAC.6